LGSGNVSSFNYLPTGWLQRARTDNIVMQFQSLVVKVGRIRHA
jgi:hypothetical protein